MMTQSTKTNFVCLWLAWTISSWDYRAAMIECDTSQWLAVHVWIRTIWTAILLSLQWKKGEVNGVWSLNPQIWVDRSHRYLDVHRTYGPKNCSGFCTDVAFKTLISSRRVFCRSHNKFNTESETKLSANNALSYLKFNPKLSPAIVETLGLVEIGLNCHLIRWNFQRFLCRLSRRYWVPKDIGGSSQLWTLGVCSPHMSQIIQIENTVKFTAAPFRDSPLMTASMSLITCLSRLACLFHSQPRLGSWWFCPFWYWCMNCLWLCLTVCWSFRFCWSSVPAGQILCIGSLQDLCTFYTVLELYNILEMRDSRNMYDMIYIIRDCYLCHNLYLMNWVTSSSCPCLSWL